MHRKRIRLEFSVFDDGKVSLDKNLTVLRAMLRSGIDLEPETIFDAWIFEVVDPMQIKKPKTKGKTNAGRNKRKAA